MAAIGAGAVLAFTPQCGDEPPPPPSDCSQTRTPIELCERVETLAACLSRDSGAQGTAGEASGGNGAAGTPGVPPDDAGQSTCPSPSEARECFAWTNLADAPPRSEGMYCCYYAVTSTGCFGGRPFGVRGETRTANASARSDWSVSLESDAPAWLDPVDAATIARGWLDDALAEHASVASFARFTLDLLALGAPSDLVLASQRAALDEVRHARVCFALSSRYSGKCVGPGVLDTEGALETPELASFAARTVREGCIGETIAALIVAEEARSATDPEVRRLLEGIASDEAGHAELAWKSVRWALEHGDARVRVAVARAFDIALCARPATASVRDERDLRRHGRLRSTDVERITAGGLLEVVAPCARALLSAPVAFSLHGDA